MAYKGKSERSQLTGYADKYFSSYIRERGASNGKNTCYTCGILLPVEALQCGHYMSRRYGKTRWHPLNCWPQCNDCNVVKGGNLTVYRFRLTAQFGIEAIEALEELAHTGGKMTVQDIQSVIDTYK